jgi:DNA polymerase III epsilon subunit-like protein
MELAFDTETTGKWDFKAPYTAAHQPRLIQLGAVLRDEKGRTVASCSMIANPKGWTNAADAFIASEAMAVHGITQGEAEARGFRPGAVLRVFQHMLSKATIVVGHNIDFDLRIMENAFHCEGYAVPGVDGADPWPPIYCTMKQATNIVQVPGGRDGGWKWPKLSEAYRFFTLRELSGAHDALVDVYAAMQVRKGILRWSEWSDEQRAEHRERVAAMARARAAQQELGVG